MSDDFTPLAEWNFDQAEAMLIFELKTEASSLLKDLTVDTVELCYKTLRALWREIDSKLKDDEKIKLNDIIKILEEKRKGFLSDGYYSGNELNEFGADLERLYLLLCLKMKEHGLYFREKFDPRKAALRV